MTGSQGRIYWVIGLYYLPLRLIFKSFHNLLLITFSSLFPGTVLPRASMSSSLSHCLALLTLVLASSAHIFLNLELHMTENYNEKGTYLFLDKWKHVLFIRKICTLYICKIYKIKIENIKLLKCVQTLLKGDSWKTSSGKDTVSGMKEAGFGFQRHHSHPCSLRHWRLSSGRGIHVHSIHSSA